MISENSMTYYSKPIKIISEDKLRIACNNCSRGVYKKGKVRESREGYTMEEIGRVVYVFGRDRDSESGI